MPARRSSVFPSIRKKLGSGVPLNIFSQMSKALIASFVLQVVGISAASSGISTASSPTTSLTSSTPTSTSSSPVPFPPVGSIPRDFSPKGLEQLWDLVGPVEAPPFTTTRVPTSTKVILPSPPPPLYPSFYAPAPADILPTLKFPPGFKFGVATAAYQVEGAVKNEGKGPNVWDWNSRQPGGVLDNTTADVVDLQYFLYKEDVVRTAALGVNAHSFSISWARIFPFGTADSPVNQQAIDHYSDLIDYHIQNGIAPVVTLFHWDTPLALAAYYGGFTSPQVVDDFINYAKTVFAAYNGRVQTWYTFNEPRVFCSQTAGYPFNVSLAPGVNSTTAPYQCAYNVGLLYRGIPWRSNTSDDALAVERHAAFRIGVFADPFYTTGDWPTIMTDTLPPEYLPRFTEQEKADNLGRFGSPPIHPNALLHRYRATAELDHRMTGSADFFAIDSYREQWITAPEEGIDACLSNPSDPLWPECHSVVMFDSNAGWAAGISPDPLSDSWLQATPNTLRSYLKGLQTRWPTNKMYVSEFGFVEPFEELRTEIFRITEDVARTGKPFNSMFSADYFMTYLGQILLSIHEDGVPIMGAFAWAMVDNAEWNDGLSAKFGIQYVNYTTLERTYKRSALSLSEFFKTHLQD
ncbi:Glycoside hydrolase family 1 protein [Mycena sanguinolenta]|uniref:Glycoside hydrolase family 1 protein n=1 Tax=Mycena sanguinolenta TaxID=230812 RepID=A0A8H6ZIG3_9AGAR|nr:Glycoside hydrolase family 1 protein [Mycena sanguinolenta]